MDVVVAVLLSLVVVAYNNAINWWKPFQGAAYVPINLTFAAVTTWIAIAMYDLSSAELGLRDGFKGASLSLAAVALFALLVFLFARSQHGHHIVDARVVQRRGRALGYYVLVRIPLGTAVVEELVFRGALFAAWREAGVSTAVAALAASAAFGVWHISPTIIGFRMNEPEATARKLAAAAFAGVAGTTLAGLLLTWLRLRSGGLIAPIVIHAGVNSFSALASAMASRHNQRSGQGRR
ncbi:MAG: CPBP family intramembrane glutamic endopeptidase [Actinomycetota bacterium]